MKQTQVMSYAHVHKLRVFFHCAFHGNGVKPVFQQGAKVHEHTNKFNLLTPHVQLLNKQLG